MGKTVFGIPLTFVVLIFAVLLLNDALEKPVVNGKVCEKASQTWSGICVKSGDCNNQCIKWEDARFGGCHYKFPGFMCFCYFDC